MVGACIGPGRVLPYGRLKLDPCPGVREVEKMGRNGRQATSGTGGVLCCIHRRGKGIRSLGNIFRSRK